MADGRLWFLTWFLWGFLVRRIRWFVGSAFFAYQNKSAKNAWIFLWWKSHGRFPESLGRADSQQVHQWWEPTLYTIFDRNGTTLRDDVGQKHIGYFTLGVVFPNLKNFQNPCISSPKTAPSWVPECSKGRLESWVKWVGPYFECFGQLLVVSTKIELYGHEQKETWELFDKYLPETCMRIRSGRVHDCVNWQVHNSWGRLPRLGWYGHEV